MWKFSRYNLRQNVHFRLTSLWHAYTTTAKSDTNYIKNLLHLLKYEEQSTRDDNEN
jgi:hypothetical protein